jgi:hypothetical protein
MHHMYIQEKRGPARQWLPTSYKLTTSDVCLIENDWEEDWKVLGGKTGQTNKEEEKYNEEEELTKV